MDVVPPPATKAEVAPQAMAIEPPQENPPKAPPKSEQKPLKKPSMPKKPASGVTMAIVATVFIVLGLASLAVYAYLKQNK